MQKSNHDLLFFQFLTHDLGCLWTVMPHGFTAGSGRFCNTKGTAIPLLAKCTCQSHSDVSPAARPLFA